MLHLTNGASVIPLIRDAGIGGAIVPWDDVLHEGPVPIGLNPAALSERRAEFLASCGWGSADAIGRNLAQRDATVGRGDVDEVVLWFEHDLYDQLQLLQILDRFPLNGSARITAVPDDEYLGCLSAARFKELFELRREVTSVERIAARDAWDAFRSPTPQAVVEVVPRVSVLQHMGAALTRHLEQFPSIENGLSRTEQQALEAIADGVTRVAEVYTQSHHGREEAVFMGDAAFLFHVGALLRTSTPLLRVSDGSTSLALDDHVELTHEGWLVLRAQADRVALCGIDRWLGGVYLSGTGRVWRWDRRRQTVRIS